MERGVQQKQSIREQPILIRIMSRRLRICSGLQWMPKIRKTVLWICVKQGKIKEGEEGKMEKVVQPVRRQTIGRGRQKRNEDQKERVQKKQQR